MSIKITNLRLELDDPEESLPGAGRAAARRLARTRYSAGGSSARAWTPGGHDDLHFMYAMEVELPEDDDAPGRVAAGARRRALRPGAVRLARARLATAWTTGP